MFTDALLKATVGRALRRPLPPHNAPRFSGPAGVGHVESWFVRANHPTEPRALWLKATILAPDPARGGDPGPPTAGAWAIAFDGARGRTFATRLTIPWAQARFHGGAEATAATVGPCDFVFGRGGTARGALLDPHDGPAAWDLAWHPTDSALGDPLVLFPYLSMLEGPFPRSKLVTPVAAATFSGRLDVFGERWDLGGWHGMQGHNWGREHSPEYAWGQCLFVDAAGAPHCMAEGFTARVRMGKRLSPPMSALVVRRGAQVFRFDRTLDFWRQRATVDGLRWTLRLGSPDGEAHLALEAAHDAMVCLGYGNPDGSLAYCHNSKLARARLSVNPVNDDAFTCESAYGAALELLSLARDPHFDRVV